MTAKTRQRHTLHLALGGLFCALFFVSSNILPPVQIIPGVPITFQVLVVALMAGLLGWKFALAVLGGIFLMTLAGIPMMSGFAGGPAAFMKPTAGYMVGWVFIALTIGFYRDLLMPSAQLRRRGRWLAAGGFMAAGILGVIMCYACGACWLSIYSGTGFSGFWAGFIANAAFFPADAGKILAAYFFCRALERVLPRCGARHA